ncbi:substrate-binding domain-containing protein [Alsobacter sp. R-9]
MSSLKTLAQSLGLSITTVSRALDNYSDVSEATRARVRAAAEAAGYRPNAAARRLRKGSTEMVTMVLPTEPGQFNEPLYIELLAALGKRLAKDGYDLTLLASPPGTEEIKTYRRLVEGRRTDGLIVVRTRRDDARIRWLLDAGFPFVAMGRTEVPGAIPFVDGDGEAGFREATRRLVALGHRRIALLGAPAAFTFATLRRAGYLAAMAEAGLAPRDIEVAADEEGGHEGATRLLTAPDRPTALLCATDRIAYGALRAARRLGLAVPADLSVVGHDNLPASAFSDPPLTTMELPIAETGDLLAETLLARIAGEDVRGLQRVCPVRFVERQSMGPPPP